MKNTEDELSADEFRNKLYSKLKEKGHVDALKVRFKEEFRLGLCYHWHYLYHQS